MRDRDKLWIEKKNDILDVKASSIGLTTNLKAFCFRRLETSAPTAPLHSLSGSDYNQQRHTFVKL